MKQRDLDARDAAGGYYPLVMIDWVDSCCNPQWHAGPASADLTRCRSVGWLIHDGEDAKVVAAHIADEQSDMQRNAEMTIPAKAITRLRRIS
jgi:hypothetical protein